MDDQMQVRLFDETTLKRVISSAVLMSSIDGEVHEKEWDVIKQFMEEHWQDEYESFEVHEEKIKNEIKHLLNKKSQLQQRLNSIVDHLTCDLTSEQKNIVLNLVGNVMIADGIMTIEESKLFSTFMEKMGIRIC